MDSSLRAPLLAFLCALSLAISLHSVAATTTTAYPTILGPGFDDCSLAGGPIVPTRQVHSGGPPILPPPEVLDGGPPVLPSREVHSGSPIFPSREVHGNSRIFDISHKYVPDMPVFESNDGLGNFLWLQKSMKNGSLSNDSEMKMPIHTGTHVDAPGHVFDSYFDAGFDVDSLDLEVLNGPALLVDVPRDTNITAEVMKSLNIPSGVRRVLYRTLNTDRRLMFQKEFDPSYVGFTVDGAKWLAENTDIKLIGLDYLSVISFTDLIPGHLAFLEGKEIILVEALKLDDVPAGLYSLHCLPLRLAGADGSPLRCVLIK